MVESMLNNGSKRLHYGLALLGAVLALLLSAACAPEDGGPKPTIRIADTQFESGWINNAIAEFVIEHGYGYPVEQVTMTTPIMQTTLANGDVDLHMELWQQNIIDWYNEEVQKGNIENLGMTYEGGPQFFVVPTWFAEEHGIKTVEDMKKPEVVKALEDPEDPSKGAFINCIIGWQCAEINRAKLQTYGLTDYYNIISPGSSAALDAALAGQQKKQEPVFGYYWAPTSIMGAYDWTIVEEPPYTDECWAEVIKGRDDPTYTPKEACAYETLPVEKGIWTGLKEKAPDVVELLAKMNVGLEPINKTAAWAVENEIGDEWERAAIYYLENSEDRWTSWMPADKVQKVKDAIAAAK